MEASRSLAFDKPIINPEVRLAGMCPLHEHMDRTTALVLHHAYDRACQGTKGQPGATYEGLDKQTSSALA